MKNAALSVSKGLLKRVFYAAMLICLFIGYSSKETKADIGQYDIQLAQLFKFFNYITWPDEGSRNYINLCVLGNNPFGENLFALKSMTSNSRKIEVRVINSTQSIVSENCSVVYFNLGSAQSKVALGQIKGNDIPVLTVSDAESFAESGGIIGFVASTESVKFDINASAASKHGISISSKLFEVARSVIK